MQHTSPKGSSRATSTRKPEWWQHLRPYNKRKFWKQTRQWTRLVSGDGFQSDRSGSIPALPPTLVPSMSLSYVDGKAFHKRVEDARSGRKP